MRCCGAAPPTGGAWVGVEAIGGAFRVCGCEGVPLTPLAWGCEAVLLTPLPCDCAESPPAAPLVLPGLLASGLAELAAGAVPFTGAEAEPAEPDRSIFFSPVVGFCWPAAG